MVLKERAFEHAFVCILIMTLKPKGPVADVKGARSKELTGVCHSATVEKERMSHLKQTQEGNAPFSVTSSSFLGEAGNSDV